MKARLLVDAGNTRLKWVRVENGAWQVPGQAGYDDLSAFSACLQAGIPAWLASVASDTNEQRVMHCLAEAGASVRRLTAAPRFDDLVNGYVPPGHLGVDRWMALIAARARTREPVIVVSAGTALTVDALDDTGRFIGGVIVPGRVLMRQALLSGTARVRVQPGYLRDFPVCTEDAVESGLIRALLGTIRAQHDGLAALTGGPPRCLLTGGDAPELLAHLEGRVQHVPALVLEGVDSVARKESGG